MFYYKKVLVISDNPFLISQFNLLMEKFEGIELSYACSPSNAALLNDTSLAVKINSIHLKTDWEQTVQNYDLVFSLHCKQLFPAPLVSKVKCINVHPGYNPYNRGWFPQVFSILNNKKAGATIHEIDEQLDHGAIIAQTEIEIEKSDTSLSAYEKIQEAEVQLLKENLENILSNNYTTILPNEEGNINLKKDFNALCEIDLEKTVTMSEAIDYLRAMTHGNYKNAYFIDKSTGLKVFVAVQLEKE